MVSEAYDPLLAKLLVVAEDRPAALARAARALDEYGGRRPPDDAAVPPLAGRAQPAFRAGRLGTDFVARALGRRAVQREAARPAALLATARSPQAVRSGSRARPADGSRRGRLAGAAHPRCGAGGRLVAAGLREATERWPDERLRATVEGRERPWSSSRARGRRELEEAGRLARQPVR